MTNEEILVIFLKSKRKYSSAKRQLFKGIDSYHLNIVNQRNLRVDLAINYLSY